MARIPGLVTTGHTFTVPLDHHDPSGPTIDIFAREVASSASRSAQLGWLLFLQGGPGGKAPRPVGPDGWIGRAVERYRVLLLDQRGTGRSTPITAEQAADFDSDADLAAYLRHFRADSIVADAELVRSRLCPDRRWATLGQSYGGFVTLTYLSQAPAGLERCYITGGLPGVTATADEVYARTYPRVRRKNAAYYRRYPDDAGRVRAIAEHLAGHDVLLPDGDPLTPERFRHLGLAFGMGDGFERVHWLLEEAWDRGRLARGFRYDVMAQTSFANGPLHAVLQEACYAQDHRPTNWAAERAMSRFPEFDGDSDPLLFTGEMMYRWMFRDVRSLQPFAGAVESLAAATDWTPLYDAETLTRNEVPVAAVVYHDDMYVDTDLSLDSASRIGNVSTWVTNEWEHDGVRVSGGDVFDRLRRIADDLPPVGPLS